jgi:hypothetical protein
MAQPVYDEDGHKDSLTPEAIRDLEDKHSTGADEAEDNAIEAGGDPESMPHKGAGRKLRERSEQDDAQRQTDLNKQLNDEWRKAKSASASGHEDVLGNGYKAGGKKDKNAWQKIRERQKLLGAGGILAGGLIAAVVLLFSFLNVFKLDDLMSNIDVKTFSRFNAAADRRSDKWVQSYLFLRLMQLRGESNADPDSEYFRANKVDTNNPIKDWYHTLRTSNFEADLAKSGVVFSNRDVSGPGGQKITFAVLQVNGKEIAGLKPGDVRNGDLVDKLRTDPNFVQSRLDEIDLTKAGASKDARQLIKQTVNENTRFTSVLKRRQVRKDVQNMTGVRDWRFFEKTRDKVTNKKIDIRDKIITKAIPENVLGGKFIRCFFGISNCRYSDDPKDPQYQSDSTLSGEEKLNPDQSDTDKNGKVVGTVEHGPAADIIKQIIGHINVTLDAINVIQNLDLLSHINNAITHHEISKGVAIARGTQAMGLYQVFETSRDQMKTGQLTSEEVNQFMQVIGPVSHGEGWTKVISGKGDPSKLTDTAESRKYCSTENQAKIENNPTLGNKQFAYLCGDKQVGGTSNATNLENAYKSSIGGVLGPILDQYDKIRHTAVIGAFADFLSSIYNTITGVVSGLLNDVFSALHLQDNIDAKVGWLIQKAAAFLGAGPTFNGNESAPVLMNWLVQGGAFTAEATTRASGAAATTVASKVTAEQNTAQHQYQKFAGMSVPERYLSLSNPDSPAANTAFALSNMSVSSLAGKLTNFGAIFKVVGNGLASPFIKHSSAATNKGYEGTDFAAIQTFDFPSNCYARDPLSATPQNGTNIKEVMAKNGIVIPDSELTWDLVDNSDQWYKYVYDKIGDRDDADKIAEKIYNCNLLDTRVRGGVGYVYGYTDDDGLNDNTSSDQSSPTPQIGTLPQGSAQDLAKQVIKYLDDGTVSCNGGQGSSCPDIRATASGQSIKNASCYVDKLDPKLLGMLLELAQMGHKFVLSAICTDHPTNPGSLHHQGKAADFNYIEGVYIGEAEDAQGTIPWTSQGSIGQKKISVDKKLDQDVASFMPKGTGFGQQQCHPTYSFLSSFVNFSDGCHHQHIQVP